MKRLAFILLLLLASEPVVGQAAFKSERVTHGGFFGPVIKFSSMNEEDALLFGVRGGWILNLEGGHSFVFGGGAYGVMNDVAATGITHDGQPVLLGLDYGGLELAYVNRALRLVHVSVQTLVGMGGIDYRDVEDGFQGEGDEGDGFLVVEPGVHVMLNVIPYLRLGGGVSYRLVDGVSLPGARDADLSGVSSVVTLQLGSF